jgi:outer membrane protein assembly factor BamB
MLTNDESVTCAVDVTSNRIVSVGDGFVVSCLDLNSGAVCWQRRPVELGLSWGVSYAGMRVNVYPHLFQGMVIVTMPGQKIVALALSDGGLAWQWSAASDADPYSYHPCVTEDGEIFHIADGSLYRIEAVTGEGEEVGRITLNGGAPGFEVHAAFCDVTTTHVWGVTHLGVLYAVNRETAVIDWLTDLGAQYSLGHPFVLCNNRIYIETIEDQFVIHGGGGYRNE